MPKNSRETVPRYRYRPGPDGVPCNVVSDDTPGRTTCYAADAHSTRRKTCNLLVDPDGPFAPTFPPGLYLYGHPSFDGHDFVCEYLNVIDFEHHDIDTRAGNPPPLSVAVLEVRLWILYEQAHHRMYSHGSDYPREHSAKGGLNFGRHFPKRLPKFQTRRCDHGADGRYDKKFR